MSYQVYASALAGFSAAANAVARTGTAYSQNFHTGNVAATGVVPLRFGRRFGFYPGRGDGTWGQQANGG